jgi:type II secretory pathway component PulF
MLGGTHDTRASVYRRLASLENAGIPLLQSVDKVVSSGGAGARMLSEVQERLTAGDDPGDAFVGAAAISPLEGRLVKAATRSGSLPEVFQQLAEHYEDKAKTLRWMVYSLIYPVFLFHAAVVIPAVPTLFMDANQGGGLSGFLTQTLVPLGIIYAVAVGSVVGFRTFRSGAPAQADALLLRVPLLGGLLRKRALGQSLRVLRTFYTNGVPVLEALEAAAEACPNRSVADQFTRVSDRVATGSTLSAGFALEDGIPAIVSDMISTGETTGELDHMLEKAEHQLKESANQTRGVLIAALSIGAFAVVVILIAVRVIGFYMDYAAKMNSLF